MQPLLFASASCALAVPAQAKPAATTAAIKTAFIGISSDRIPGPPPGDASGGGCGAILAHEGRLWLTADPIGTSALESVHGPTGKNCSFSRTIAAAGRAN